ncbi:MAG: hypothetical protein HY720_07060 [Planctomycetes bacterium]|nr:hypothetical protein [Planctomycetota bacterium]
MHLKRILSLRRAAAAEVAREVGALLMVFPGVESAIEGRSFALVVSFTTIGIALISLGIFLSPQED